MSEEAKPPVAADAAAPKPEAPAPKPDEATTPIQQLWATAKAHAHAEIWGVTLADPETHVPSQIVLQKYLNANDGDIVKAREQLTATLAWRAKMQPLELVKRSFSSAKFGGLGYVTTYGETGQDANADPEAREVFTWNIYGGVKSMEETFGDLEEFMRWRVALMELAVQELSLASATKPITASWDPYKIFQVHDYRSISFLRPSPVVKAASTETIRVFATAYPELLKEKFFVNVPAIMGFMYGLIKLFVAPKTIKKFHPMSNGAGLALEFPDSKVPALGERLPVEYGGKGKDLKTQGTEPSVE
ncbi:CRAL/TRIO domain-containing protein [Durotheca rogersii]|uniref:CRAL/TRIO domain-containing protein n=1 Tax=Durotheca rogersii TaxID=419775 RepID=UPI00222002F7|nr:CRAL/TRIO domain-containing protein [Durotheca rogersii]KAI5859555.1 CRAL/TRIO domain-containing protein [Durotheca rogersii]